MFHNGIDLHQKSSVFNVFDPPRERAGRIARSYGPRFRGRARASGLGQGRPRARSAHGAQLQRMGRPRITLCARRWAARSRCPTSVSTDESLAVRTSLDDATLMEAATASEWVPPTIPHWSPTRLR